MKLFFRAVLLVMLASMLPAAAWAQRSLTLSLAGLDSLLGWGHVRVILASQGNENTVAFSLNYDRSVLSYLLPVNDVTAKNGVVTIDSTQAGAGHLGVTVALPAGTTFSAGSQNLVDLTFQVIATATKTTSVAFGDTPTPARVVVSGGTTDLAETGLSFSVSPNDTPAIIAGGVARQVVAGGQSVTLGVTAINVGVCRWVHNGATISGATTTSYTIPAADRTRDAGWYQVSVLDPAGSTGQTSSAMFVGVVGNPMQILGWGDNSSGQLNIPAGLTDVIAIAAGETHVLALKSDGTVVAWGSNTLGEATVPAGLTTVVAIAAGTHHSLALKSSGAVVAWGDNSAGQTTLPRLSGIVAIAAAGNHNLALGPAGSVTAWGSNTSGESTVPGSVVRIGLIAAGLNHSLAANLVGDLFAWGNNADGETSHGVVFGPIALASHGLHSLAVQSDNTVAAWGYNGYGQTTVPAGLTDVVDVAAGDNFSLALGRTGWIRAWGRNEAGQTNVPAKPGRVVQAAAGGSFGLALVDNSLAAPLIQVQPVSVTAPQGGTANLSVQAIGNPAPAYQWQRKASGSSTFSDLAEGNGYTSVTGTTLTISAFSSSMNGDQFRCVVSNSQGATTSDAATLTVGPGLAITSASNASFTVGAAGTFAVTASSATAATFSIASGSLPAWAHLDASTGVISGTPPDLSVSTYTFTIRATSGSLVVTQTFTLTVTPPVRLITLGLGETLVPTGGVDCTFTITGTGTKSVFIRSAGPSLTTWGALADPQLTVRNAATNATVAYNDDWAHDSAVTTATAAAGGSLPSAKEAALVLSLAPGTYTINLSGTGGTTGLAALSLADLGDSGGVSKITYFSARKFLGSSEFLSIDYEAAGGNLPVLVRGMGPSLGLADAASDPYLMVYQPTVGQGVINNDNWAGGVSISSLVSQLGATPFASSGSKDSAAVAIVPEPTGGAATVLPAPPGGSGAGTVLVEVFDASVTTPQSPYFIASPLSQTVAPGGSTTLSATLAGTGPLSYQWRKNGTALTGATGATFTLTGVASTDGGQYDVVATNAAGSGFSQPALVTVGTPTPPAIVVQPASLIVYPTQRVSLSVGADGSLPLSYQWRKDGSVIAGATDQTLAFANALSDVAGSYDVVISNAAGSVTSFAASVTVATAVAPQIVSQPASTTLNPGNVASFSVTATGTPPPVYQWQFNGANIDGATNSQYVVGPAQFSQTGNYDVVISNPGGAVTSQPAALNLITGNLTITSITGNQVVVANSTVTLSVTAGGTPPFSYQWRERGAVIPGATTSSIQVLAILPDYLDNYSVVITNSVGTLTSDPIFVVGVSSPPTITQQPFSSTVGVGGSVYLSVAAGSGPGPTYQWRRNGVAIPGATSFSLSLSNVQTADSGDYTVVLTNPAGSTTSAPGHVTVTPRVISASARLTIGNEGAIGTFTVEGTAAKQILLRVVGPALGTVGISGYVPDPQMEVYNSAGSLVASNNDWGQAANASALTPAMSALGALPFALGSHDSAVLMSFGPGSYSVRATGVGGVGGVALLELYDADIAPVASTLPFFAVRGQMSAGDGVLIGGLGSDGRGARSFLLRAIGPALGLSGALADPSLSATREGLTVGSNDNWDALPTDAAAVTTATNRVAAFPLPAGSHDAALVLMGNLHIGAHTAQIGAPAGTSGLALLELHDLDSSRPTTFAPVIVSPPVPQAINQAAPLTLNVLVHGTGPLTYAWRKDGVVIAGATAAVYTVASAQLADAGSYTVVVTNSLGTAISLPAAVTVANVYHSADTDHDGKISLLELTRVIELYNTRNSSVRTGAYKVDATGEDGFAPDATRVPASAVTLANYHSADENRDGSLSLLELTRVIEIYNYRVGTVRTGQYHVQAGTEDGFTPGP